MAEAEAKIEGAGAAGVAWRRGPVGCKRGAERDGVLWPSHGASVLD